jgi:dTDP-glucose 4,6-dehydratase
VTTFLVTGGAGFIGSALCRRLLSDPATRVVNVDKLTYAASLTALPAVSASRYRFCRVDINDVAAMRDILRDERPEIVVHLAAESHVDRSIRAPDAFAEANMMGTFRLLCAVREYWEDLRGPRLRSFRFHHVSTDEVFGDLPLSGGSFSEGATYAPNSPYAASKAAADLLVRAWHRTYGLPVVVTHSSNTYGPYQHWEKLIPRVIVNALTERPIPVYGDGRNVRDWLHVTDHAVALELVARRGRIGEGYNIGGRSERSNLVVVRGICDLLDRLRPRRRQRSYGELITFVADRPGHDRRYAVETAKIEDELGWCPSLEFEAGLAQTVEWYLANESWWKAAMPRTRAPRIAVDREAVT